MKLQSNLNDDEIFQEVPITMRILLKEIQNHNDLLIDANCQSELQNHYQATF